MFSDIRKRDGRRVPFDIEKIVSAIGRAFGDTGETADERTCRALAGNVVEKLEQQGLDVPAVEAKMRYSPSMSSFA